MMTSTLWRIRADEDEIAFHLRQDRITTDRMARCDRPEIEQAVIGVEALIRWRHPVDGLVTPSAFLHYVEGSELEVSMGVWVIESALQQMQAWRANGIELGSW